MAPPQSIGPDPASYANVCGDIPYNDDAVFIEADDGGSVPDWTCGSNGYSFTSSQEVPPHVSGSASWTITSDSFDYSGSVTETGINDETHDPYTNTYTLTLSMTDSSVSMDASYTDENGDSSEEFSFTVTLSDPNNASDVLDDITTLLEEWDLTDDAQYPWRTDAYISIAPLVVRNEVPQNADPMEFSPWVYVLDGDGNPIPTTDCLGNDPGSPAYIRCSFERTANVDPNALIYDGSIIGGPLPAGYQQAFDFYYVDWQECESETGPIGYVNGWGALNNGQNGIPLTATHWTPNQLAWQFPAGAWIFYNHNPSFENCNDGSPSTYIYTPGNILVAQKWAETRMGFVSQNFARPAGKDKFAYDEDHVFAINSTNTTNGITSVYLITTDVCANANASPSTGSGIWGGNAVNGFFEASGNGNPFTLGTKIYNLPSDWQSVSGDDDVCFGLLRFPNAPAILGLANISNVANANANAVQLTTDALPELGMNVSNANADHIDIFDVHLNLLSANQAVTRIDDAHFTVNANFAAIANAAQITINGSPAYYWDDEFPKGDYAYTDWTWWPRLVCEAKRWNDFISGCDSANCSCPGGSKTLYCFPFFNPVADNAGIFTDAFTQEPGCLAFTPCAPAVLCISPNSEAFDNGITYDFPTIYLDEQYGSGWQAEFQQVMQDLLYQTPHYQGNIPCTPTPFAWTPDNGSCQSDTDIIHYYAHPPLVECRITLPANGGPNSNQTAPALPSGITIGWTSPAGLSANCSGPPDNTLFPLPSNGYGMQSANVWNFWSNECACIDGFGVFSDEYQNTVVGCQ